ncbi:uncharacterized protein LACBIDRAFT_299097 [Laccaria bicolor S238N-H82]|uniref:Predicted protein n=1 Tax=Laccaria bicolor (strain S238N-H82 / ATCC MYA-4686) TaxID=486041 RepID=B0DE12_LACBS|nr:uncharacterized protein LACBIDRAFT_299097 [Laccaria bicolor S238N-H82]EDR07182.1 predicted protein [Laccaria bicolor S238N-H82]|eukprot:XP_001882113.1 predicted protein [Laccaria bicolor S238N-H82]
MASTRREADRGATSLTATWQPNDECLPTFVVRFCVTSCSRGPSTMVGRRRVPTFAAGLTNGDGCPQPRSAHHDHWRLAMGPTTTIKKWRRPPTDVHGCPAPPLTKSRFAHHGLRRRLAHHDD